MNAFIIQLLDISATALLAVSIAGGFALVGISQYETRIKRKRIISPPLYSRLFAIYLGGVAVSFFLSGTVAFARADVFKWVVMALLAVVFTAWAVMSWRHKRTTD